MRPVDAVNGGTVDQAGLGTYLEEEADDEDLQGSHADDHGALDQAEVDDSALGAADGAEVAVLAGAEVLLVPGDGRQLARDLVYRLLEGRGLFGRGALFGGDLGARLVLDLAVHVSVRGRSGAHTAAHTAISKSTTLSE